MGVEDFTLFRYGKDTEDVGGIKMKFNRVTTLAIIIMSTSQLNKPFEWVAARSIQDQDMQQQQQQQQPELEEKPNLETPEQEEEGFEEDEEAEEEEAEEDEIEEGEEGDGESNEEEEEDEKEEDRDKCDDSDERQLEVEEEVKPKQMKGRRPKVVRQ